MKLFWPLIISFIVPVLVLIFGDALFIGIWYYILVPIIFIGFSSFFQYKTSFYIGLSLAILISFLFYLSINIILRDGQLLVLHLIGLPLAFLMVMLSPKFINKRSPFLIGFASFILGMILGPLIFYIVVYCLNHCIG